MTVVNSKELRDILKISKATLNRRVKDGIIKPITPPKQNRLFILEHVIANLNEKTA